MDPILGQIILWPVPWVPQGWTLCDGKLLYVNEYAALYSLLGTIYGGDGRATFGVPDLRNRVPVGTQVMNQVAQVVGAVTSSTTAYGAGAVTLTTQNLPTHTHAAAFAPSGGAASVSIAIPAVANPSTGSTTVTPGTTVSLTTSTDSVAGAEVQIYSTDAPGTTLRPFSVSVPGSGGTVVNAATGLGQPASVSVEVPVTVSTLQPSLTLNYIMAVEGIYPSRP